MRGRSARALAGLSAALVLGGGALARANGAFPAAGQVIWDPAEPSRYLLKTNYGLVATADAGATWTWTCEAALDVFGGEFHPQLAKALDGTIFGGLPDGMVRGRAGACDWGRVADLEGLAVVDVSQGRDGRAIAAIRQGLGEPAEIWASDDGAVRWSRLGAVLPIEVDPFTLDAAPSDPTRLYVSGILDKVPKVGGLAASSDGGATWAVYPVPHSDPAHTPYIAAVDPIDPDVVWVRLDGAPGEVLRSTNGGLSFQTVLRGEGFVRAFALSPDGQEVLAGGEVDGLLRASVSDLDSWEPFLDLAVRCASWTDDTILVCGSEPVDDFSLARWSAGEGLVPLYRRTCLVGPEDCEATTAVGACAADWPGQRDELGATGCGEGGAGGAVAATSTASASSPAASASGGPGPGEGSDEGGGSPEASPGADPGCGCDLGRADRGSAVVLAGFLAVGAALARRSGGPV